jgi:lipoprotein-anchoring transpeptidase ErfK/SrfK
MRGGPQLTMPSGLHARMGVVALAVAAAALAAPAAGLAAQVPRAPQQVAVLKDNVLVRAEPRMGAASRGYVARRRPITQQVTTLPVLDEHEDGDGVDWLQVRTPGRGSKRTGWILASSQDEEEVGWRIYVDRSDRRARIYYLGVERASYRVVIGKPNTQTPTGSFFVEENVREPKSHGIGPYAIALSARSGVYREFDGGPGQIALHGTGTLPGALGSASSHGCVRFANSAINWLGERIDAGTPVTISE